ncbi:hypothetical protein ACIGCM_20265 [Pseudomonas sp. NPDC078700]|uniref:hypothetical protein n=1 Tax=Pseudomonas sp. NPDC078700 TaxID=3364424 RepID=UPI0037CA49AD
MNPHLKTIQDCESELTGASDALAILTGLFSAISKLDQVNAAAVARAGRYIAEDWANMLDVDAEQLRAEASALNGEVQS